ncbi:AAA family ATPase [Mesorhizobium sp.]|uniref:AAA family ATPase n=1 Tax=Mesorhizobium sp. TaxID=1871066 RepID=UPI000FE961B0|nr:AAA family ATPase [Mesorhizobium sp.]RWA75847.1 MAG: OLD family endonuclease [Mesorhizobium sp.]TIS47463.1 MAG: OLD family endonuclease [Mesorhizobium sp.]
MRLKKARVTNYRSVKDSGWIDFEPNKTILVGPNEAGKSALLKALQQINAPSGIGGFDALRDYPRGDYNDITAKRAKPSEINVAVAHFELEAADKQALEPEFQPATYVFTRRLDNSWRHDLEGIQARATTDELKKDLARLAAHVDGRQKEGEPLPSKELEVVLANYKSGNFWIFDDLATSLIAWLEKFYPLVDEADTKEEERYDRLLARCRYSLRWSATLGVLRKALPVLVLFSNYFRVRPLIHLDHLATRIEQNLLDDAQYDYGNQCLLKLLGFTARELSDLGKAAEPSAEDADAQKKYRDQLDNRSYQLNAASVRLTDQIVKVWNPNPERAEASRLRITADGQYLKVVVEDGLGVEIELDQRSEGFQWLVSFFVVFFSETEDKHANAILLLDEPGMSLHALKQRDFRNTISMLSESNQTVYTTHSPFLVGPNELDLVRVVEMADRKVGTKVHTTITAADPAALLPLQEALGYDLAQSLFAQQRNLILEGLTDFWYLEATSEMLRLGGIADLSDKIALISANTASKVVYFATILIAHNLKVAALLDSDNAGDQAAKQEVLVHRLGAKRILRTMDFTVPPRPKAEIEDLLRAVLIPLAAKELGIDVTVEATTTPEKPLVDLLSGKGGANFSKYKLAKAYVRWTRDHTAQDLSPSERDAWAKLIGAINVALK